MKSINVYFTNGKKHAGAIIRLEATGVNSDALRIITNTYCAFRNGDITPIKGFYSNFNGTEYVIEIQRLKQSQQLIAIENFKNACDILQCEMKLVA